MQMKSMRRTAAERKAEDKADGMASASTPPAPEADDIHVRLEPHHIEKLGLGGALPHGTEVHFEGHGEVGDTGTHEGYRDAEPRHQMTIRLRRAGVEHNAGDDEATRGGLKDEIKKNSDASEARAADRDANRTARRARDGAQEPEKAGG